MNACVLFKIHLTSYLIVLSLPNVGRVIGLIWEKLLGSPGRDQVKSLTKLMQWHSASHVIIFIYKSLLATTMQRAKLIVHLVKQLHCAQFPQIHKRFNA